MKKFALLSAFLFILCLPISTAEEAKYTNTSFARLNFIEGNAYVQRASDLAYEEGTVNMPISEGDRLGTTEGRAEVYMGNKNYLRLDNSTKLDFLSLPKKASELTKLRIWAGNVYLSVRFLEKEKSIEVHTPDASFYILDKGLYRFDVKENGETELFVFKGLVEAAGE